MSEETTLQQIVAAALLDHDRVLLARRTEDRLWYPGLWDLPGGHVENGETEPQAVVREMAEELGVLVTVPRDDALIRLHDYSSTGAILVELSVWVIHDWIGEVRNNSSREHSELRWFTGAELPPEIAHPEYISVLGALLTGR